MCDKKETNIKHFLNAHRVVLVIGVIGAILIMSTFFLHSQEGGVITKASLVKEHLLPTNAIDIQDLGNGWICFCLKDVEIWRFRHPYSHEMAIDVLDRRRKQEFADETKMKIKKLPRERRAERWQD